MKADLKRMGDIWMFNPDDKKVATASLIGYTRDQAINYATQKGCTEVTEWHEGKQVCTHTIPKATLGKGEA